MKIERKTYNAILAATGLMVLLCSASAGGQPVTSKAPIIADDLDRESLRVAIQQSMAYLAKLPPDRIVGAEPRRFTAGEVLATLRAFESSLKHWDCRECWIKHVADHFEFIPSASDPEMQAVLFTGYYQPLMEASLAPTAEFKFPIYGKPADLIVAEAPSFSSGSAGLKRFGRWEGDNLVPYYSRAEIDQRGLLRNCGCEIAWFKDPVDIFFLHIQGSGMLRLPDGKHVTVGYAAQNGRPYRSIGRLLIDDGRIPEEEMSMQRLRRYLAEHLEERDKIMAHNESYIFFRVLSGGPLGSLDVPVTAGRSIATDSRLFPKGALAFVYSERPVLDGGGRLLGWTPFLRFVLNQDTGGAIRGPRRVDLYFGTGAQAGGEAGYMNSPGKLYFLAKKKPAPHSR